MCLCLLQCLAPQCLLSQGPPFLTCKEMPSYNENYIQFTQAYYHYGALTIFLIHISLKSLANYFCHPCAWSRGLGWPETGLGYARFLKFR